MSSKVYNRVLCLGLALGEEHAGGQAELEEKEDVDRGLHRSESVNEFGLPT
jgi:hypothetical protein